MTWAHYLLQVNIYLVIFYAFYKLLLDKETYFMLNRLYLIAAGLFSLTIPFMKPEWFMGPSAKQQISISIDQLNMMMANVTVAPDQAEQLSWGQLVTLIYIAGILFFVARLIFRLFAVRKLISNRQAGVAFSFFNKKVIDDTLPQLEIINRHEEIHIRQLHTMDILFFELLAILVWCNPIIYLYKTTVKNIHEYLADEEAALFQGDKESYAMLLLSKAFGVDQSVLTNSFFNKSLIKKRIFMLHKQRSKKTAILKYGLFLPMFATMLLLSSAKISRNEEIKSVAEKISVPSIHIIPSTVANSPLIKAVTPFSLGSDDSWKAFYKHLSRSIRYPIAANQKKLQGNTIIKFAITNGEVRGISVVSPLGSGCDAQVMKSILGYEDFKAIKDGKYSIKIAFRLTDANSSIKNAAVVYPKGYTPLREVTVMGYEASKTSTAQAGNTAQKGGKVYDFVSISTQPGFPGGMDKFYKYLAANCNYPAEAREKNIQGKVFLSFIIEEDGSLTEVNVVRGVNKALDAEALRLMKNSPSWTPGYDGNQPVRVKYNIPISFTLSDDTKDSKPKANGASTFHTDDTNKYGTKSSNRIGKNPMYFVDGIRNYENAAKVDPRDIESMTVVKGLDAVANYGEEGKDGVVLIITRKERHIFPSPLPSKT